MFIKRIFEINKEKFEAPFINSKNNNEKKSASIINLDTWDKTYLQYSETVEEVNCTNCYNGNFCRTYNIKGCEFQKISKNYNEREQLDYNLSFLKQIKTLQQMTNLFQTNLFNTENVKYGEKVFYDIDKNGKTNFYNKDKEKKTVGFYTYMKIPKKTYGEFREVVTASNDIIKEITNKVYRLIKEIYTPEENVLAINKGVLKSIPILKDSETIFAVDISNFFNSIKRNQIKKALKEKFELTDELANILSIVVSPRVLTDTGERRRLWAGLQTSNAISSIVFEETFVKIKKYCDENDLVTLIYVDDLGFGSKKKLTNEELTKHIKVITKLIDEEFNTNYKKTRCLSGCKRYFLGVNYEIINTPQKYRDNLRAQIYQANKKINEREHEEQFNWEFNRNINGVKEEIQGKLAYQKSINEEIYNKIVKRYAEELKNIFK